MKKIIATVLAMVMALALCTTAFAAIPVWSSNGSTANVDLFDGQYNTKLAKGEMTFTAAKAPVVTNGALTTAGRVAYYTFDNANGSTELEGNYVLVDKIPADADASNYVLVKANDDTIAIGGRNDDHQTSADQTLIMKKVTAVTYGQTATAFTAWGDLCAQYKKPADADKVTYVSVNNVFADKAAQVWSTYSAAGETPNDDAATNNVLVGSEVYTVKTQQTAKAHTWTASAWDKDGAATEYKCVTCKTVAKVINASVNAPAGSTVEKLADGTLIAFTYTPGTAASGNTGSASSPKTFDAGIAMYVGMALTSVAGSAVVIGKKKEF